MKFLKFSLLLFIATIAFSCVAPSENGAPQMIKTEVPERPAGQTDMLQFAAEPIPTVRVGFVGLGMRGPGAVQRFTHIPGVEIVALCDLRPERVDAAQEILRKAGFPEAAGNQTHAVPHVICLLIQVARYQTCYIYCLSCRPSPLRD
jgi:hypothetical protein